MNIYSYSKISLYQQCPRKFKYAYIDKLSKPSKSEALVKGSLIHESLETGNYENEYKDIILNFVNSDIGSEILSKKGITEYQIKLDSNLEPTDSNHIFVGYIDRINTSDMLELIDFKTGKYKIPKYQTYTQLIYYSIWFFKKYPKLQQIKIRYVYVEHSQENSMVLDRSMLMHYLTSLKNSINEMERATYYPKNNQRLCDFCEFKEICEKDLL